MAHRPKKRWKLVSWNVNGLRAAWRKGFAESLQRLDADVACIQETKLPPAEGSEAFARVPGYESFWSHCAARKGYSGVGVYTRTPPLAVRDGFGDSRFDNEGRVLEMDFGDFLLFNVYFPNGQAGPERLQYKLDFYEAFFAHADACRRRRRNVVVGGDFNTAHNEIDLANPKANENYSGFLRVERDWLDRIVARGWVDTFRRLHPDAVEYSWWTYRFRARERNIGWRIDYFFVSGELFDDGCVQEAFIDPSVPGSDHCPVGLVLAF
ncbi:MAG: exodeoxyribonuclease III [Desulfobacterales bacterium]